MVRCMTVLFEQAEWGALTDELREQLARLLPLEARDWLASPEMPSANDVTTISARLEHLWDSIRAMAPRWIVDSVDCPASPCVHAAEATLLFADVTGFTPFTAQLETLGRVGNEHTTNVLNRFFATVVPIALTYEGDLLSFGGDAILVAFHGSRHAQMALAAAWEMQQAMESLDLHDLGLADPPRLQMKIGLASGPLVLASVGVGARRLALPLGSVLDPTDAMANATAPGGIRLDARAAALAAPFAQLAPQPDGSALLVGLGDRQHPAQGGAACAAALNLGDLVTRIVALGRYLPQSVLASVIATLEAAPGSGEQRYVVSMFSHLSGLHELADAFWSTDPGLVAQAADLALHRAIALIEGFGGVLARVDIYDGGHKLLALFGAPV